jgi:hypothetical protein
VITSTPQLTLNGSLVLMSSTRGSRPPPPALRETLDVPRTGTMPLLAVNGRALPSYQHDKDRRKGSIFAEDDQLEPSAALAERFTLSRAAARSGSQANVRKMFIMAAALGISLAM